MSARAEALQAFLHRMPFVQFLGMQCDVRGDEMTAILPYQDKIIGNAALPAVHGGCIGSFLELTAMAQVFLLTDIGKMPRTIDLTVDYLRSAGPESLYARASVKRMGRRMANVHAEAWQAQRDKPVATLHAHLLVAV